MLIRWPLFVTLAVAVALFQLGSAVGRRRRPERQVSRGCSLVPAVSARRTRGAGREA